MYTRSWNCQMLAAEQLLPDQAAWVAFPSVHHGKNHSYWATILQLSWSGRQSRSTLWLSASPSPPIQVYCTQPPLCHTEHMTSKREYSKGRCQIFLAVILFGSCPPRHHSWYSHNCSPFHSPLLIELVQVCLFLVARGTRVDQTYDSKTNAVFSPFIVPCIHAISHIQ
jgi:hypothetical protein